MEGFNDFGKRAAQASESFDRFSEALGSAMDKIKPDDLSAVLVEFSKEDKQNLLRYFEEREMYSHCHVIHESLTKE